MLQSAKKHVHAQGGTLDTCLVTPALGPGLKNSLSTSHQNFVGTVFLTCLWLEFIISGQSVSIWKNAARFSLQTFEK